MKIRHTLLAYYFNSVLQMTSSKRDNKASLFAEEVYELSVMFLTR